MPWEPESDVELRIARLDAAVTLFVALLDEDEYRELFNAARAVLEQELTHGGANGQDSFG